MRTIALVGTQIFLAGTIIVMGCLLIGGPDGLSQRFAATGMGEGGRIAVGAVQIAAGVCLIVPRGQVIGAALMAFLMVGIMGVTIGLLDSDSRLQLATAR